jgi:hypothetical protein
MRKFRYNENLNIVFVNENDYKENLQLNELLKVNKRLIIQNPENSKRFVIIMYRENNQKWSNEKFFLLHEIGHFICNDLTDEASADEYAIEKMGYSVAARALRDLSLEVLSYENVDLNLRLDIFKSLSTRMKMVETLAKVRGVELQL